MSKELLRRALASMDLAGWFTEHEPQALAVMEEIKAELEKPDPEPIAKVVNDQFYVGKRNSVGNILVPIADIDAIPSGTELYAEQPDQLARIAELQEVCAEAYQFAGAYNAPDSVLDKLFAAANGDPIPKETYLPIQSANERIAELEQQVAELAELKGYAVTYVGGGATYQDLNGIDDAPQLENGTILYIYPTKGDANG